MSATASVKESRIASIDTLRGLTIFTMIFVNDVAGVVGAPAWMQHYYPYDADGMTFVDVVFPVFLFIVGMALPFSVGRRLDRGDSIFSTWSHVLRRTIALLIIGIFMVNVGAGYDNDASLMHQSLWAFLMFLAVLFVWNSPPEEPGRARTTVLALRCIGIAMLVFLALVFKSKDVDGGITEMRTYWWGILGLIGLAFFVATCFFMAFRHSLAAMGGIVAALYCVFLADKVGTFNGIWLRQYIDFGAQLGSHSAIVLSGAMLGVVLSPKSPVSDHRGRILWAAGFAVVMAVAAWLLHQLKDLHPMFIVNKNAATVPWCLYCSAITVAVWIVIYLLMDVIGWRKWAVLFEPGGANPLFAYILHPLFIHGFVVLGWIITVNPHAEMGTSFPLGFSRALLMAFAVTWLAGWLMRRGIVRLKL